MATLEQLERARQQALRQIVSTGDGAQKDSQERRQALQKDLAAFGALVLDASTKVCTAVEQTLALPPSARMSRSAGPAGATRHAALHWELRADRTASPRVS